MLCLSDFFLLSSILLFIIFGVSFCYSPKLKYPRLDDSLYLFFFFILSNSIYLLLSDGIAEKSLYNGLILKDSISNILGAAFLLINLVTGFVMRYYNKKIGISTFEYLLVLLLLGFNSTLLISSDHLFLTFVLIEVQSGLLIILAAINRRSRPSIESGLKYFILGSFSSILLLLGISLLYVTTSFLYYGDLVLFLNLFFSNVNTSVIQWGIYLALPLIAIGFLFKVYSAPFHFWVSDIYQGSANSAVLFFSTSSFFLYFYVFVKLYFVIFFDLFYYFQFFFIAFSILSMVAGAIGGLMQRKLKRVIAYSSVTATGYLLLVISSNSVDSLISFFVFFITYMVALFGIFIILSQILLNGRSFISFFGDFENFYKTNKAISFLLSSFFFSLGGVPPFAGFVGKFEMLGSLFFNGYFSAFLAFLIISTISFLYYARIVKSVYTKDYNKFFYFENFSFFNAVIVSFCFIFLLMGLFYNGSLYFFSQLLVFNLIVL